MSKNRGVRGEPVNGVEYLYFAHSTDADEARKFLRDNGANIVGYGTVDDGAGGDVYRVKASKVTGDALTWVESLPKAQAAATNLLEQAAGRLAIERGRSQG